MLFHFQLPKPDSRKYNDFANHQVKFYFANQFAQFCLVIPQRSYVCRRQRVAKRYLKKFPVWEYKLQKEKFLLLIYIKLHDTQNAVYHLLKQFLGFWNEPFLTPKHILY